jgi:large subunit ribosomal protein L24
MKVKKDDKVVILSGKDKGKEGKVMRVEPSENKVVVQGVGIAMKHQKPSQSGQNRGTSGGIIKMETPLYASKVMPVCPKCGKPTRVGYKIAEDGSKIRACKHCGAAF